MVKPLGLGEMKRRALHRRYGSRPVTDADVEEAVREISTKTPEEIEGATAIKCGARAAASWRLASQAKTQERYLHWFKEATAYKHEALEHAGWGPPGLVDKLRRQLKEVP